MTRVHIIDDDDGVREGLGAVLSAEGYDAVGYADAATFLGAPMPGDGDVVVLDLGLPHGASADVARVLRARGCHARIVAVSGLRRTAWWRAVRQVAPDIALRKPLETDMLLDSLATPPAAYVVLRT